MPTAEIGLHQQSREWFQVKTENSKSIFSRPINLYYMLIGSTLALSTIGLVMVFSASSIYSLENKGSVWAILLRQFIFLAISLPMAWLLSRLSLAHWKKLSKSGVRISLLLLIIVQIPSFGKSVNGNHNWISLGFVDVQPSEIAKFLMILWAGAILANHEGAGAVQTNVLKLIAPAFILCIFLVLFGHDLGTASVFAFILAGLLWISGVQLRLFAGITAFGFAAIAALIATAPYRVARLSVFLDPFAAEQYKSVGWQPAHSLLGLASGGLFGVGLGASRQKWGNLPEAHTDFILSVIGEELGLFGTLAVLLLLSILLLSIFRIAVRAQDPMVRYVCSGVGCWIGVQTFLNVGSAISVLPVVGVTLPLLSYGGSALIATYMGIAFVIGAARRDPAIYSELAKTGIPRWLR